MEEKRWGASEIDSRLRPILRATITKTRDDHVDRCVLLVVGRSLSQKMISNRHASRAERFDSAFWSGEPLDGLYDTIGSTPMGPAEKIFARTGNDRNGDVASRGWRG